MNTVHSLLSDNADKELNDNVHDEFVSQMMMMLAL